MNSGALQRRQQQLRDDLGQVVKPPQQYLAEFRRFYGDSAYRNALYPTRDHVIPFREFWQFYECMPHIEAQERLNYFRATTNTLACAFSEKNAPMIQSLKDDLIAAYLSAE